MNASLAAALSWWEGPASPACWRFWAATRAPPTGPSAALTACAGRWRGIFWSRRLEYSEAATLPVTATPRAAPKSRVASLTADPTPALAVGTAPMIASVAGGGMRPSPTTPRNILPGVGGVAGVGFLGGAATMGEPPQASAGGHHRLVAGSDGEPGAHQGGDGDGGGHGQEADAGAEGRVALDELEVLGDEEREPGEGQERDGNGAAGSGETRVPKQPDVE